MERSDCTLMELFFFFTTYVVFNPIILGTSLQSTVYFSFVKENYTG